MPATAQSELDLDQAVSNLAQTQAQIPPLEIDIRQSENRLCTLLGIPATDLRYLLGTGPIPAVPPEVAVGIPAELLRRRPDVRQAERLAAAQAEQIGIAEAQLYPTFSITGVLNWQATNFKDLFNSNAFNGNVGPQFQWNILNYGRLRNNVLYQDALLKDLIVGYQSTVLQASQDAENGIVDILAVPGADEAPPREPWRRTSRPSKSPSSSTKKGPSISPPMRRSSRPWSRSRTSMRRRKGRSPRAWCKSIGRWEAAGRFAARPSPGCRPTPTRPAKNFRCRWRRRRCGPPR